MIRINNIKKSYDGREVLSISCISIEKSGVYVILGANGSGKTTLLDILSGYIKADSGSYIIGDDLFYMPQKPYIFSFSVKNNVLLGLDNKDKCDDLVITALNKVGMADFIKSKGNKLSGGECQRVAFARLLVGDYKYILLDEPTSAMDIEGANLIVAALLNYVEDHQAIVIMTTHSPALALKVGDYGYLLHNGIIIESDEISEVINHPKSDKGNTFFSYYKY